MSNHAPTARCRNVKPEDLSSYISDTIATKSRKVVIDAVKSGDKDFCTTLGLPKSFADTALIHAALILANDRIPSSLYENHTVKTGELPIHRKREFPHRDWKQSTSANSILDLITNLPASVVTAALESNVQLTAALKRTYFVLSGPKSTLEAINSPELFGTEGKEETIFVAARTLYKKSGTTSGQWANFSLNREEAAEVLGAVLQHSADYPLASAYQNIFLVEELAGLTTPADRINFFKKEAGRSMDAKTPSAYLFTLMGIVATDIQHALAAVTPKKVKAFRTVAKALRKTGAAISKELATVPLQTMAAQSYDNALDQALFFLRDAKTLSFLSLSPESKTLAYKLDAATKGSESREVYEHEVKKLFEDGCTRAEAKRLGLIKISSKAGRSVVTLLY
jgi:hypothetical protein